jgi:arylsulfatase A-like enzyme
MKRVLTYSAACAAGGVLAGLALSIVELSSLLILGNAWDWAAFFWGLATYGALGLLAGIALGVAASAAAGRWLPRHVNWWMLVGGTAIFSGVGFVFMRYRLLRDMYQQRAPLLENVVLHVSLLIVFGGLLALAWRLARRWAAPTVAPSAAEASPPTPAISDDAAGASLSRRTFLKVALVGGLAAIPAAATASQLLTRGAASTTIARRTGLSSALSRKPNIILIVADTVRADHLGAYGYARAHTPQLDRLAADSLRFAHMYSQASWTRPSMATLFTSLYPSSHRTLYKNSLLPSGVMTLAGAFSAQGYVTGGFGNNVHVSPLFNFQRGFSEYEFLAPTYLFGATEASSQLALYQAARQVNERLFSGKNVHNFYQPAEVVNEKAIRWITQHQEERFMLFLHYMEAHDPYFDHPYNGKAVARVNTPNPSPEMAPEIVSLYDGEIAYLDQHIGALVEWLKGQGMYDDTLIAFTADHGEEFYEHGGWWHGLTLYEEQLHVPLFMKLPQQAQAGGVDEKLARTLDLAPTLLHFAGFDVPPTMQGLDLLDGDERAQLNFAETDHEGNIAQAIRGPEWKLIRANAGNPRGLPPLGLYHVASDPGETKDLSSAETAKVAELTAHLDATMALAEAQAVTSGQTSLDAATLQQLRNLGY